MKKIIMCLSAFLLAAGVLVSSGSEKCKADNPMVQTIYSTDPAPMVYNDRVYVYTGRDKDNSSFYYMPDWHCYSSDDMQNWTDHGMILSWNDFTWGKEDSAWASQCIERNGKFYYYVTLENNTGGGRGIGVAVADSPTGPFKDALGKPLCGPNWDYIDPTVFIDDDGQAWLMFGNPTCYYVKLNEDMISVNGAVGHFEMNASTFGPGKGNSSYGEGPWFFKRKDLYYLMFAAFGPGNGSEDIRYSTAPSPTGPWTYRGVVMPMQGGCFTNHSGVVDFKDKSYFFYHNCKLPGGGSFDRSVAVEEFQYNPDGTIPEINMSQNGPKQIAPLDPFKKVEAETICFSKGVKTEKDENGGINVGFIENNDYIKVKGVDFKDGATGFTISAGSGAEGGSVELHIDSLDGKVIGKCQVTATGGWHDWKEFKCDIDKELSAGTHDLYLVFKDGNSFLFNADWWEFTPATPVKVEPEIVYAKGDLNNDKVINIVDYCLMKEGILEGIEDKAASVAADLNNDEKVGVDDAIKLLSYLLGKTESLE